MERCDIVVFVSVTWLYDTKDEIDTEYFLLSVSLERKYEVP